MIWNGPSLHIRAWQIKKRYRMLVFCQVERLRAPSQLDGTWAPLVKALHVGAQPMRRAERIAATSNHRQLADPRVARELANNYLLRHSRIEGFMQAGGAQ
jgi:hypothetical protein